MSKRYTLNVNGKVGKYSRKGKRWNSNKGFFEAIPKRRPLRKEAPSEPASFPGKRKAHKVGTVPPKKQRTVGLYSPSGKVVLMVERPTNLHWQDEDHNPEFISNMMNSVFHELKTKAKGRVVIGWRGGFTFKISKKDKADGSPIWSTSRLGAGTHNYSDFNRALSKIKDKLEGVMGIMDTEESEHRYRVWILSLMGYATLAGKGKVRGIRMVARNFRSRKSASKRKGGKSKAKKAK